MRESIDGVAAVIESAKPDPNRQTTQADVAILIQTWRRLHEAEKAHKTALSDLAKGLAVYSADTDYSAFMESVEATAQVLGRTKIECRRVIDDLPNGVTGPGGAATRQTVVLEFYGPVNRNLRARLSSSDAKAINKAAFNR